jgi:hypothetical protein
MSSLLETKTRPGPWRWFGDTRGQRIYLATQRRGRIFVMSFDRWGMRGATPTFQVNGCMEPASELARFEVGDPGIVGHTAPKASPGST